MNRFPWRKAVLNWFGLKPINVRLKKKALNEKTKPIFSCFAFWQTQIDTTLIPHWLQSSILFTSDTLNESCKPVRILTLFMGYQKDVLAGLLKIFGGWTRVWVSNSLTLKNCQRTFEVIKCCKGVSSAAGGCQVLSSNVKVYQMLPSFVKFCQVLSSAVTGSQVLSY